MSTRNWLNSGLLAAVAVLGVLAWLRPGTGEDAKPALTPLSAEQVERVRLHADGATIELRRDEDGWRMIAPHRLPAHDSAVKRVFEVANADVLSSLGKVSGEKLDEYGLAEAKLTLALDDTRIAFGDTNPLGNRRYVKVDGRVSLIGSHHYRAVDGAWPSFASRSLVPGDVRIERIELPERTLARGEDGWRIEPATPKPADGAIQDVVRAWRNARALSVATAGDGGKGSGDAEALVRVHLGGREAPLAFRVKRREPRLTLIREDIGLSYELTQNKAAQLLEVETAEASGSSAKSGDDGAQAGAGGS